MNEFRSDPLLVKDTSFSATILVKNSLSWSENNVISIITQHGTYLLEPNLSCEESNSCLSFKRSFIDANNKRDDDHLNTGMDANAMIPRLAQNKVHTLIGDIMLSAKHRGQQDLVRGIGLPGGLTNSTGFSKGAWSPAGIGTLGSCILCLVTYDHEIQLYGCHSGKWLLLSELASSLQTHISKDNWKDVSSKESLYDTYIARINRLALSGVTWSPVYFEKFAFLIAVSMSGHAAFWRFCRNYSGTEKVAVGAYFNVSSQKASSLQWLGPNDSYGYLIVGTSFGEVQISCFTFNYDQIQIKSSLKLLEAGGMLSTDCLKGEFISDTLMLLAVSQNNLLRVFTVSIVQDEMAVISTADIFLLKLPVSGIFLNAYVAYVCVKDGSVIPVEIKMKDEGLNLSLVKQEAIFTSSEFSYIGMDLSPNRCICAVLGQIFVPYDHLVLKDPAHLMLYLVNNSLCLKMKLENSSQELYQITDILESLRLCYVVDSSAVEVDYETTKDTKAYFWLIKRLLHIPEDKLGPDAMERLSKLKSVLLLKITRDWFRHVLVQFQRNEFCHLSLSQKLQMSLNLMCLWLCKNGRTEDSLLAQAVQTKLESGTCEKCLVCGIEVQFDNLHSEKCRKGHGLPRCCRSLLLTKSTSCCLHCSSFLDPFAASIENNSIPTCLYCGAPVQLREK